MKNQFKIIGVRNRLIGKLMFTFLFSLFYFNSNAQEDLNQIKIDFDYNSANMKAAFGTNGSKLLNNIAKLFSFHF